MGKVVFGQPHMAASWAIIWCAACGAPAGETGPQLIDIDASRTVITAGGRLSAETQTTITVRVLPAKAGVVIAFTLEGGAGEVRAAQLSAPRASTDRSGQAHVRLVSSDAVESCEVLARLDGMTLRKQVRFVRRRPPEPLLGSPPAALDTAGVQATIEERAQINALIAELSAADERPREAARRRLVGYSLKALPHLVKTAFDGGTSLLGRMAAARALGEIRDEAALKTLMAFLADPRLEVQQVAQVALVQKGARGLEPVLRFALEHRLGLVRAAAVELAALGEGQDAAARLRAALADGDPYVRATAAWSARQLPPPGAGVLLRVALADDEALVRQAALQALGVMARRPGGLEKAVAALAHDRDPQVRAEAACVIGLLRLAEGLRLLKRLLRDDLPQVRRAALLGLAALGGRQAHQALREAGAAPGGDKVFLRLAHLGLVETADAEDLAEVAKITAESDDARVQSAAFAKLERMTCCRIEYDSRGGNEARRRALAQVQTILKALEGMPQQTLTRSALLRRLLEHHLGPRGKQLPLEVGPATEALLREGRQKEERDFVAGLLPRLDPLARRSSAAALCRAEDARGADDLALQVRHGGVLDRALAVETIGVLLLEAQNTLAGRAVLLETLFSALADENLAVRRQALHSLTTFAGRHFSYRPEAGEKQRQTDLQEIRKWWSDAGKPVYPVRQKTIGSH